MTLQQIILGTHHATAQERIDEAMAESFPASDPPSWTSGISHDQSDSADQLPAAIEEGSTKKKRDD